MTKLAFIGAGSLGFTRGLVRDVLTFPLLKDSTISLMDIDPERLDFAYRAVSRIVEMGNYPAKVEATLSREEALDGADAVMVTILAGSIDVWQHDILIPKEFGVDTNIGDTRGPSGIFRALRTIPVMLGIAHDMERLCPDATMLNYTNPMAMLCRAMQRETSIKLTGLCHSVQGTAMMLAKWIEAPFEEITYTCAGINHMAWYLNFEWNGKDAYPLIRKAITENPDVYNHEQVRNEMFLAFDLLHHRVQRPQFGVQLVVPQAPGPDRKVLHARHRLESRRIRLYSQGTTGRVEDNWREDAKQWFAKDVPISLERGHEYAAHIINALKGGEPFQFNGNVPNTGLVTNLPQDACVEVPVWASKKGLEGVYVGPLPPQCAALTNLSAQIEEMAVEASISGDPRLGILRHRQRSVERRSALAGRNPGDDGQDAGAEPGLSAPVQALQVIGGEGLAEDSSVRPPF